MKKKAVPIPEAIRDQRLSKALDRLIRLAEATDDQKQLEKWLAGKGKSLTNCDAGRTPAVHRLYEPRTRGHGHEKNNRH